METKTVNLIVPGANTTGEESHRQILLNPGMTTGAVLTRENLQGYQLSLGPGKPFLATTDNLYDALEPFGKLYATTVAQQE